MRITPTTAHSSGSLKPLPKWESPAAIPGAVWITSSGLEEKRWITGSFDPDLKLTYWGTAQPENLGACFSAHDHRRRWSLHKFHRRGRYE